MPKASKSGTSTPTLSDGAIVVTSQQSRFHVDAVDAPTSKDVDVKDLTLTVGGRELLDHAHLRLVEGVHYVLAGRNGTGKSSLLRALAERRIPGIPSNLRFLLLGQTRVSSDALTDPPVEAEDDSLSVLQHVTRSDRRRERALREAHSMLSPESAYAWN
jgi:ATPase subunit of ABC transporter with duplicated ATPase domains